MGNTVTVKKGDVIEVYEDVLGHQVGYSHIQVLERNGNQRIISDFDEIDIVLDEAAREKFERDLFDMEHPPQQAKVNSIVREDGQVDVAVEETEH